MMPMKCVQFVLGQPWLIDHSAAYLEEKNIFEASIGGSEVVITSIPHYDWMDNILFFTVDDEIVAPPPILQPDTSPPPPSNSVPLATCLHQLKRSCLLSCDHLDESLPLVPTSLPPLLEGKDIKFVPTCQSIPLLQHQHRKFVDTFDPIGPQSTMTWSMFFDSAYSPTSLPSVLIFSWKYLIQWEGRRFFGSSTFSMRMLNFLVWRI